MAAALAAAAATSSSLLPTSKAAADERQTPSGGKRLTLLHFTDTHAILETHPEYVPGEVPQFQMMGGFARLKTALDRHRQTATGPAFVFDGGDEFQGSGPAAWSRGEAVVDPLNALRADAFVPGNWEPVYGPARFKELMARLKSPVTCFNFHDVGTGRRLFQPHLMLERDAVRVAVVGVTDILASKRQAPAEFEGMDTTRMDGLKQFVRDLRDREKPDLVVAVMHTGLTIARQLARDIPEFDVVLSGHTHERTPEPILEGHVIVVEPGCFGSFLGRLDLVLKPTGGVASHRWQLIPVRENDFPEDASVRQMVDRNLEPYRTRMREQVCQTQTPLYRYDVLETSADNLITDAVRETAGADIGLSNGFRFGPPILAGAVTRADVWNLLPMDTRMKVGWVTGRELREYLENELELVFSKEPMKLSGGWGPRASGMTLEYNAKAPPGKRLVSVRVGGKEVEDAAHYTLAGCEREGEPLDVVCRHRGTHDTKVLPVMLHAALNDYFKAHPVVSPVREGRAVADDLAPVVFSQDAVVSDGSKGSPYPSRRRET